ncbi:MAG: hypothetical protein PHI28_15010 [Mangrovibacterium sp.]|nr:hypothetical protein [Mangrovibacterium sp.]
MNATDLSGFLPERSNEWSMESDQYFNTENLYDYIDGAAELYLSYGFKKVISRRYACPDEMDIVVEIFDMNGARDAFGVFSNMREKNQHEFGQGSQQIEGSLIFWKDHYFVSLTTHKNTEKSLAAIKKIAGYIDHAIGSEGQIPGIVDLLPQRDLVPEGYCYFHHYIWINSYYYIANYNILNVDDHTDAVIAKYGSSDKRTYLLLVQYPDKKAAQAACDKFVSEFSPELKTTDAVKLKDNGWHTVMLEGTLFASVFNAPDKEEAIQLLKELKRSNQISMQSQNH